MDPYPTRNLQAKWKSMNRITADVQKQLTLAKEGGHDVASQIDALTQAHRKAVVEEREIIAADARADEAERQARNGRTLFLCICEALLVAHDDSRARVAVDIHRITDAEMLAMSDEFAQRTQFPSALAEGLVQQLPLVRSQFLATSQAAKDARTEASDARITWGQAVLQLDATLASVRAQVLAHRIKLPERRKPKAKPSDAKLETVSPAANDAPSVTVKVA